jgi:hypothetical protein
MGSVPVIVFLVPVVGVIAAVVFPRLAKQLASSTEQRYAEFRLADLAPRLGLHIVEGDPSLNMLQAHVAHNMARGWSVGGLRGLAVKGKETRVRLEGTPYGRPTRFTFFARTEGTDLIGARVVRRELDCRLSVRVPVELPPFEIVLRRPSSSLEVKPELGLPAQSFGDPQLDAHLVLHCADPRLGPVVAPAVVGLTGHRFLHLQGTGDVISSLAATEAGLTIAVYHLTDTQVALEHLANVLAGPVTPRR